MAKQPREFKKKGINLPFLFVTVLLSCIGIIMVYSSTYNTNIIAGDDPLSSLFTQVAGFGLGYLFLIITSKYDYHNYAKKETLFFTIFFILAIAVLAYVRTRPAINNAHRWIKIFGITVQPSEFAKILLMLYTSVFVAKKKWKKKPRLVKRNESGTTLADIYAKYPWATFALPICVCVILILIEPDLSTCICICAAIYGTMLIGDVPKKAMLIIFALGIFFLSLYFIIKSAGDDYHASRFYSWLHAWEDPQGKGYQVIQSLYAIGDGGLFGVGLGNSKQAITHLPMSESDYIFSIICEEFGFVGALVVIGLFIAFAVIGIAIALKAPDSLGTCIAFSITLMITLQALLNMAVATNVGPSTGVTLPFISKGASSIVAMLTAVGIVLNVSSQGTKRPKH